MKKTIWILGAAVLSTGFMALTASPVSARGVTPLSGMEWVPSERTCFFNSWNQLTNANCSGYRKWLFDAPIDNSNNYHSVAFYGRGDGSTVVKCWAVGTNNTGTSGWSAYGDRASTTWAALSMASTSVWVPSGGNLHADCDLPYTGGVSAFHYSA
jgi:hypothetical protein